MKKIIVWRGIRASFGLMFQIPDNNKIYILDLGRSAKAIIHTFFCLRPLDIYVLSEDLEIVDSKRNLHPFRIFIPKKEFRYVIESFSLCKEDIDNVINYLSTNS